MEALKTCRRELQLSGRPACRPPGPQRLPSCSPVQASLQLLRVSQHFRQVTRLLGTSYSALSTDIYIYIYIYTYIYIEGLGIRVYIYMFVYIYVRIYIRIYIYTSQEKRFSGSSPVPSLSQVIHIFYNSKRGSGATVANM